MNSTFHTYAPTQYEGLVNTLIAHDVIVDVKNQAPAQRRGTRGPRLW